MKILLIGGTGVLGTSFCKLAQQHPHAQITALVRSPEKSALLQRYGVETVIGDILDVDSIRRPIENSDVVLNFASAIPRKLKPSHDDWELNDKIRIEGISNEMIQHSLGIINIVFYF